MESTFAPRYFIVGIRAWSIASRPGVSCHCRGSNWQVNYAVVATRYRGKVYTVDGCFIKAHSNYGKIWLIATININRSSCRSMIESMRFFFYFACIIDARGKIYIILSVIKYRLMLEIFLRTERCRDARITCKIFIILFLYRWQKL